MTAILIGLDIGGVNIKCTSLFADNDTKLESNHANIRYFPLWVNSIDQLTNVLEEILYSHINHQRMNLKIIAKNLKKIPVYIGASITGELSDVFNNKNEGITKITSSLFEASKNLNKFNNLTINPPVFVGTDGNLLKKDEAVKNYRLVSAANWYATSKWVGSLVTNCIFIDCGSTTTDIIPIITGEPNTVGTSDIERLSKGELVYTGVLRATIPSITHILPYNGEMIQISFEKFALMADAHYILDNISKDQYKCDTADGRPISYQNCLRRLGRMLCEDLEVLGEENIKKIAKFLYEKQQEIIRRAFKKVVRRFIQKTNIRKNEIICVITGLGEDIICKKVAESFGIHHIIPLSQLLDSNEKTVVSSAIGVLYLLKEGTGMGK